MHRLRTSTRRLRSELQALGPFVRKSWRKQLEGELKWLAGVLGDVRDLDILDHRLRATSENEKPVKPEHNGQPLPRTTTIDPLLSSLHDRHERDLERLRETLQSERYGNLVKRLDASIESPSLRKRAMEPCGTSLRPLGMTAWKRLKKAAEKLEPADSDGEFHRVRKLAKRARYTAELISSALGQEVEQEAKRFVSLTTDLQDVLGEHQDATVAVEELSHFLAEHPKEPQLAREAKRLIRHQRQAADRARSDYFRVWASLNRKKSIRWLKPRDKIGDS